MKAPLKFASAGSKENITFLVNKFYYSTTCSVNFQTNEVSNKFGVIKGVEVIFKKGRYIFQSKPVYVDYTEPR